MQINHVSHKAYNYLLDLIFPVLCVECSHEGIYLCSRCEFRVSSQTKEQVCPACTLPAVLGKTHLSCATQTMLDGFIHSLRYKDPTAKRLVELMKYHGIKDISHVSGLIMVKEILNQSLAEYFQNFILVPIPLHPKRLKWRGYNQSELLAQTISKTLNLTINIELLIKTKHSTAQAKLNKQQRKENLTNAFTTTTNCHNKKILLIDDVATTRSTLNEAASALKKAQALEVWALTLAYES